MLCLVVLSPAGPVPGGAARDPLHGGPGAGRHLAGGGRAVRPRPRHPRGGGHLIPRPEGTHNHSKLSFVALTELCSCQLCKINSTNMTTKPKLAKRENKQIGVMCLRNFSSLRDLVNSDYRLPDLWFLSAENAIKLKYSDVRCLLLLMIFSHFITQLNLKCFIRVYFVHGKKFQK